MFRFVERSIKVGDLLTSVSILVSVLALVITLGKDREVRRKEQADKVRSVASRTLGKMERWSKLALFYFDEVDPLFVQTSEMVAAKNSELPAARDYLWRELKRARIHAEERKLDEELENAYVELFSYHPCVRTLFVETLRTMTVAETSVFEQFLASAELAVLDSRTKQPFHTANLGNSLRAIAERARVGLDTRFNAPLQRLRDFLAQIVLKPDADLVEAPSASAAKVCGP
jgi:hypothetical protein